MSLISVSGLSKNYVTKQIFSDVSFRIEPGDKVGIVGVNGAGKTTLFRILTEEENADSGTIFRDKNAHTAYMNQHADYTSRLTPTEEVCAVFADLVRREQELDRADEAVSRDPSPENLARQARLREDFIEKGGLTYKARIRSTLLGLGFAETELEMPSEKLSGGQKTRILLARILLSGADLILLDEPTNHLDISATRWLEDFLASYKGAVAVISHDRYFLDKICNRIFDMENGRLTCYTGNYTAFVGQKALARKTAEREFEKNEKEIRRIESIIEQQKRFNQERNYVTIKSKQKQIDRIKQNLVRPDKDPDKIGFSFRACSATGNEVVIARNLTKSYGANCLFRNTDFIVRAGDRVFITGGNGCGKTTLLRLITGSETPSAGTVNLGARVIAGYYDQNVAQMSPGNTVFDEIANAFPALTNTQIRSALSVFLFRSDDVFKQADKLSGGEMARVALAKLMLSPHNLLILDEPTNHLDIASKQALEEALQEYDGTMIVVSHDRYFINRLATRIFDFDDGRITVYNGGYEFFTEQKSRFFTPQPQPVAESKTEAVTVYKMQKEDRAAQRKKANRIDKLERLLDECAAAKKELETALGDPAVASDYSRLQQLSADLSALKAKEEAYYDEWASLQE